ncbi:TIGR02444 family protein [Parahaliea aestuarii]|uniref:TIGR02444 family protein n=1 Tax=Parahaliea aestuarii TaxID=1852021 RepID=A0A5C8ZPU9_9GAMM|nr:TIGR02444 family protein [Parahaliea aestuarii]TXS90516.1 TIGR02444 family protein [Parahaliea aestuarii]
MDNPFWNYSLSHYSKPDVEALCLAAQDELGADVNLLLYAAWLASRGRVLEADQLANLLADTAVLRESVIAPLRELRRQWRGLAQIPLLREQLKTLELQAERQLQDSLYRSDCGRLVAPGEDTASANLALVLRAAGADRRDAHERAALLAAALVAA